MAGSRSQRGVQVTSRPHDVLAPPDSVPRPPTVTRLQELPLNDLTWQNFERLCFRLASRSDQAEDWQRYGRHGQAQAGIDIFVRRPDGRYDVWQCKRYRRFGPVQVRDAAKAFIKGEWVRRSATLLLCVSAGLNDVEVQKEVEEQACRLSALGVVLRAMGSDRLSEELKSHPDIVDDFFGRAWVQAVCGEEAIKSLRQMRHRLDGAAVARLREALFRFYDEHFKVLDRGFSGTATYPGEAPEPPPLLERFVIPDVLVRRTVVPAGVGDEALAPAGERPGQDDRFAGSRGADGDATGRFNPQASETVSRRGLGDWLAEGPHALLLGDAGSGKSTALRCLALDLLSGRSAFPELAQLRGSHLPILIPFSKWTHLAVGRSEGVPLEEVVRTWLERFSVDRDLVALALDALQDRRLLLLVDGLDEWANETAARTVLAQLETVVRTHAIAAVVTGRPQGVARLGDLGASWRVGTLAPLSELQQRRLVRVWFGLPDTNADSDRTDAGPDVRDRLAEVQAEDFFRDLREAGGLEALAGTPLLLTGLVALRMRRVALPRDRFRAYEELATLLLEIHPEGRARAAAEGVPRFKALSDPDLRRQALGRLAYEIRRQGADTGFPKQEAVRVITSFLRNEDEAGLPADRARAGALEMLAVNAETSGILIEKAPGEVGFVHAIFEEHLAAAHVSGWPLTKQEELLTEHCVDSRWRNVILNLFRLLSRPSEVDRLVARLEAAEVRGPGEVARRLLLAETAFSDNRLSARTARRIADRTFDEIESGAWMPEREALLRVAMNGLDSERLQEPTRNRVWRWFPKTLWSHRELFLAMARWPRSSGLREAMWRGLFGADERSCDGAAQGLAEAYAGDPDTEARLLTSVRRPQDPPVAAALLRSLARGWPNAEGLDALIDAGREACAPILRLAAVRAAVDRGRQTDADRDWLLSEGREGSLGLYHRHQDVVDALLAGWPSDPVVFQVAMPVWQDGYRRSDGLNREIAWNVLLRGYASAPEVIDGLGQALHSERVPLGLTDPWDLLLATYKRHPTLSPAFDAWAQSFADKWAFCEPELAFACAVSGSGKAKKRLLEQLQSTDQRYVFWPVFGLLEGWGMGDPDVAGALRTLADRSPERVQHFAQHLPTIVDDKTACRARLLAIARLPEVARPDFLVAGFAALGLDHTDTEVVDALVPLAKQRRHLFDPTPTLIAQFGRAPLVRELAKGLASHRNAPLAAMAMAYRDDEEMRRVIADRAAPLPASLRRALVAHAARRCRASEDLAQLLAAYDDEWDARVRTAATAGHYRHVRAERSRPDEAAERLLREVRSLGPEMDGLRQSALAGLVSLGRLSAIVELEEVLQREEPLRVAALGIPVRANDVLLQLLAERWDEVVAAFGYPPFARLVHFSDADSVACWESLAPYVGASPQVRHDFLQFCSSTEKPLRSEGLSALARLRPHSLLLMTHCRRALAGTVRDPKLSPLDTERGRLVAGKILGTTFAGDSGAREMLESEAARRNSGALVGLCLGWPDSLILDKTYGEMVLTGSTSLPWAVVLHLVSVRADADTFERIVTTAIGRANGDVWQFIPEWVDPVVSKFSTDEALFARFLERLKVTEHPNERASLSRLLAIANGRDEPLREWCQHELAALLAHHSLADVGFDVVAVAERPVAHALLDVLMPYGPDRTS